MQSASVVGLGKLGQCLAACLAARGFETIGVDIDKHVVDSVNRGVATVVEPGLQELIDEAGQGLRATESHAEAITETDITFMLLPTPSNPDGSFSNAYLERALELLATSLGDSGKEYHLFVVNSTVMPGSVEAGLIPLIEEYSGRKLNAGFGVCYSPEFVALGSVIRDFLTPDLVIVGHSNSCDGDRVSSIFSVLCENNPPVLQMPIIAAEMVKVSFNCLSTLKISFANSLANLCEMMPGADVDVITQALGVHRGFTTYCLRGGLSFGGYCFPRDTRAFIAFAKTLGYEAELIRAVQKVNEFQDRHLAEVVLSHALPAGKKVSVIGLAFKPNTPVIEESPAIKLVDKLLKHGVEVSVYDPLAMENARTMFGDQITYAASVEACLAQAQVVVITTPDPAFCALTVGDFRADTLVVDCWRILSDKLSQAASIEYVPLGCGK